MRVYIPFDDGSSVSFDGDSFTVYRRPVDIDADFNGTDRRRSRAEEVWEREWDALVRALESAWRRQRDLNKSNSTKKVYSKF